jgi:hypothetical protein
MFLNEIVDVAFDRYQTDFIAASGQIGAKQLAGDLAAWGSMP